MIVVRDDGVLRHLQFRGEDVFYWFDLITWPEYLCITGDCGTHAYLWNLHAIVWGIQHYDATRQDASSTKEEAAA